MAWRPKIRRTDATTVGLTDEVEFLASEHFTRYAVGIGLPLLESRERSFFESFADE